MNNIPHGKDLANYKLDRVSEELETAKLLQYCLQNRLHSGSIKIRHASDYDDFYIASREETLEQINTAEILIKAVKDFFEN